MTAHPAADDAERPTNRPIVVFGCSALKRSYRDLLRGFAVEHAKHVVDQGVQAYFVYRACSELHLLVCRSARCARPGFEYIDVQER